MAPAHGAPLAVAAAGWALALATTAARAAKGTLLESRASAGWWALALQAGALAYAAWSVAKPGRPRAPAVGALAFASYPLSWRAQDCLLGTAASSPLAVAAGAGWLIAAIGDYLSIIALGTKRPRVAAAAHTGAHRAAAIVGVALGLVGLIVLAGGALRLALMAHTISFTLYDIILQGGAVFFSAAALIPPSAVGGWRAHLAAVGLAAAATVNVLRTALPPYLDGPTGAIRAGASLAAAGNVLTMATLGVTPTGHTKAVAGAPYGGAPVPALAVGTAGQAISLAGLITAIVGAAKLATGGGVAAVLHTPSSTAGSFLKLAIHAAAIGYAATANPLLRGKSGGAFLGRARAAVVGLLATAAAFGSYDLESLYGPGPTAPFRRPTNSVLVYGGLFAIIIGELITMLGLGSARPPAGGAGGVLPEAVAAGPKA